MDTRGRPSTKAEIIAKYGVEYYERMKEKSRLAYKARYDANPEAERERRRLRHAKNPEYSRQYNKSRRDIYRINTRDRNRLLIHGMNLEGLEVHHLKYHVDNSDASWIDDILILTPKEHRKWHQDHPDFDPYQNIV